MQHDEDMIRAARNVNLHDWIMEDWPNEKENFELRKNRLRPYDNPSVVICDGYSGYKDTDTGRTGDAVDYFVNYWQMTPIQAAYHLLTNYAHVRRRLQIPRQAQPEDPAFRLPPMDAGHDRLYAYLQQCRIPDDIINRLLAEKAMYQEGETGNGNIIFRNRNTRYAEVHGTSLTGPCCSGTIAGSSPSDFWWFKSSADPHDHPDVCFICSNAIETISLYALNRLKGELYAYHIEHARYPLHIMPGAGWETYWKDTALYASVGVTGCSDRISRITSNIRSDHTYICFNQTDMKAAAHEYEKLGEDFLRTISLHCIHTLHPEYERWQGGPLPENSSWQDNLQMQIDILSADLEDLQTRYGPIPRDKQLCFGV